MAEPRLYHFRETDFSRIGKLLADRDTFVTFFYLAKSPGAANISNLASLFRRDPADISQCLQQLAALGLAVRRGGHHRATDFARRVMAFFEEVTEDVALLPAEPRGAVASSISYELPELLDMPNVTYSIEVPSTNNTVVSNFRLTSTAKSKVKDIDNPKMNGIVTDSGAKVFRESEAQPLDATPNHDYL